MPQACLISDILQSRHSTTEVFLRQRGELARSTLSFHRLQVEGRRSGALIKGRESPEDSMGLSDSTTPARGLAPRIKKKTVP